MTNGNTLKNKLDSKVFVYTAELGSIKGLQLGDSIEEAKSYVGLDALNLHDCPNGSFRINSIMAASIIQREAGIETVPHFTCRDRSIVGTQADISGAHALGIKNILATTGDVPDHGPYKESKGVYNLNTFNLMKLIKGLNAGVDVNEKEIKGNTNFVIAAAATPGAKNLSAEIARMAKKVESGADFFQTQPVYDLAKAREFMAEAKKLGKPIILGVMPLKSVKMVSFVNNNMDGVDVPDEIIRQMEEGKTGLEIACDFISEIYKEIDGIHIYGMYDVAAVNTIIEFTRGLQK